MKHLLPCIALMLVLWSPLSIAQWDKGTGVVSGESGEEIEARLRYLYEKHAGGPGKRLSPDTYASAVQEKLRFEQAEALGSPRLLVPWTSLNPSGMFYQRTGANYIAGRTNSMAFHPTDPNTFYCAAAGGGVWKTTNGGTNWTTTTDFLTSIMSGAVAVDPSNPSTVYFGTGELNFSLDSYYGDGVYKSTNAGTTWTKVVGTTVGSYISDIAVDPTSSNIVYLSGSTGVHKSTNAGSTWASTGSGSNAMCIIIDPTNTQVLFTSTGGTSAGLVKKSTNAGASWTTLAGGLPTSSVGRTQLAMAPSNHNTLYASIASTSSSLLGLYRTTDGGTTWTVQATTPNYLGSQGWYDNAVCVSSTDPNTVIVGGLDIYKSTTGGAGLVQMTSWSTTSASNMSHADIHFLRYNGSVLYCGSDGGVYKSTNNAVTWSDLNTTMSTLQFQSADYDPTNPQMLYGGTQDNNKQTSTNGGVSWIQRTTGDGGTTIVDPVSTNYTYGQYVNGSCQRSSNYGVSYTEIRPTGESGGLFYNPFEMAPGDPNTLVYGVAQVWKTTTARTATSASWSQIAASATLGGNASAIGISWTNTSKIYVGTSNGRIIATSNNGSTWTTTTGYPYVSDLAVDPANDDICYASFTGSGAATHVYKTTNAGSSWFSITNNLPNIPCNSIVVVPQSPRWLFVGTNLGVYYSTNDGSSWASYNSGFPTVTVYDLKYNNGPKILMAATHGRGCFANDLTSLLSNSISLSAPNGGESWVIGTSHPIQWTSSGVTGNVRIELSTNSGTTFPTVLFANTANDGSENWTVTGPASSSTRVRVVSIDSPTLLDASDANFSIVQPSVAVVAPNGGETWITSSTRTIQWNSSFLTGNVKVELSRNGGAGYEVLYASTTNDGSEQWVVTGPPTSSAVVRVSSVGDPAILDVSNAPFTINGFALLTRIVLRDNGGETDSLEYGTGATATDGIDPSFGESELPPLPPGGVFDVRWTIAGTEGAKRDVRDTLGGTRQQAIYRGKMQPGEGWYPFHLRWNRLELPAGTFTLRDGTGGIYFSVNMKEQDSLLIADDGIAQFQIVYDAGNTVYNTVQSGWNILSVPATMTDRRKTTLFPTSVSDAFAYTDGGYVSRDTLEYGTGYWLKFPSTQALSLSGGTIASDTIDVIQGWNIIGSISEALPVGSIGQIPVGIVASQYFEYTSGAYSVASMITPMRGYWVKTNQNGKLVLVGSAARSGAKRR